MKINIFTAISYNLEVRLRIVACDLFLRRSGVRKWMFGVEDFY
jgi:hypothetical protein